MSDDPNSLLDLLKERYEILRAKDSTIRKYQREAERQADNMRRAYSLRKISTMAMRKQEEWLREEAAAQIRKEKGIKTIPGFTSRRESAIAFRMALNEKHKAATAAARQILSTPSPKP